MKDIKFKDQSGNELLGTLSITNNSNKVVILSHGFSSNKDSKLYVELQNELNALGIGTFRYDYYGHGKLYGHGPGYGVSKDVTLSKAVDSLKAAIELVRSRSFTDIALMGSSFGGLISLIAASDDPDITGLVLKSPVTEPISFWRGRLSDEQIRKWKEDGVLHYHFELEDYDLDYAFWEDLLSYNIHQLAENITCPTLIIHGDKDIYVPIKQSRDLAKILHTDVKIVKGANHGYNKPEQYVAMKNFVIDFLRK